MPKAPKTLLDKIIVDKALDRASRLRQQYLESGMSQQQLQDLEGQLIERLEPIVKKWKPAMRSDPVGFKGILESGKFKNQFETNRSGGALDLEKRRKISDKYFYDKVDDDNREKYGFLKRPKKFGLDDVNWYGDYEFYFKPKVRKKMTFTNGDSLNEFDDDGWNSKAPSPIVPKVTETYINWAGQPYDRNRSYEWGAPSVIKPNEARLKYVLDDLKTYTRPTFGFDNYVEAQYHGPLTLEDVEGLRGPWWNLEDAPAPKRELVKHRSNEYGFPIYDWDGKCIYNCR